MLSKPMLKVFASSLVSLVKRSEEMREEVKRFNEQKLLYFKSDKIFNFANYGVKMLFLGSTPDKCKIWYEIRDRVTNTVLISSLQQ